MMRFFFLLFLFTISFLGEAQLYVACNGNDRAAGTKEAPFATVHAALRKARELRRLKDSSIANGIRIFVGGGRYQFSEPLFVRPEDSGPTTFEAVPGEKPVFSGGIAIKGWKKVTGAVKHLPKKAQGKIWVTDAPAIGDEVLNFRQLWVNDIKAVRARHKNADTMDRILSWNKTTEQCWIPKPSADISSVEGLEFFIHQWWAIAVLRVKSVVVKGDSALLSFRQPESRIQSEHPWPAPWISSETGNSGFYLTNAMQFLDSPGEWYLDKKARKLYYWPRNGENLATASVIAPVLETLVQVEGTADRPVSNINFKGISFQHTTWLRPSEQGHVPLQAGMYLLDAYKLRPAGTPEKASLENQAWVGRPAAAVKVDWGYLIRFTDCQFRHTASTALDFGKGVNESHIDGNSFTDIGGTAILLGTFSDEAMEAHLPYKPKDERENTSVLVENNLISDVANEDWGCVGIGAGFIRNSQIHHNDISELPYTGISVGWGWTKAESVMRNNTISANRIVRYGRQMYDVAGIYTLSAQPGSFIAGNYIDSVYKAPYAHLPSHWFYLYTDEGTSGVTVQYNWTPSEKFLQNANGPNNKWQNNGPSVVDSIKRKAGLSEKYQHLLKDRAAYNKAYTINREQPVVIELITAMNANLDASKLKAVLHEAGVKTDGLYQWQNHTVLFEKVQDASVLRGKLEKAFPGVQIKVYYDPFYEFNRSYCADTSTAREWDHILLTANLVADPKLQKEYMDYHATQFEKWPEVSKGFCNASFQRLLIYRNGRQLVLVISIPKGESLDHLNPKTTENNPLVDQWNAIMKNYQQGIEGTKPGETWIFFEKL